MIGVGVPPLSLPVSEAVPAGLGHDTAARLGTDHPHQLVVVQKRPGKITA